MYSREINNNIEFISSSITKLHTGLTEAYFSFLFNHKSVIVIEKEIINSHKKKNREKIREKNCISFRLQKILKNILVFENIIILYILNFKFKIY